MKILLLPGAFKGSLSALRAGHILHKQLSNNHTTKMFPIADGGDGFIDCFQTLYPDATLIYTYAKNAFLRTRKTSFLILPDHKTAVIETARICGLGSAKPRELDPLGASSFGVGQVLMQAVKHGAKKIFIGLGGVACNDGGCGMAVACGAIVFDKHGKLLPLGAKPLLQAAQIDLSALKKRFKGVQLIGCVDVTNPLLGARGSARVFGPQKGATPTQVKILEKSLTRWARVLKNTGHDIAHIPSCGAAGAIAAGLVGCFDGRLLLGADFLQQKAHLAHYVKWADLVITTEGKLDAQTFYGKAPLTVINLARQYKKPVLFICGSADWKHLKKQNLSGVCVAELVDFAPSLQHAKKHAGTYLARVCKNI